MERQITFFNQGGIIISITEIPFISEETGNDLKVTNTWRNQLIYDNTRPEDAKKTWTTNPPRKTETELEPSGLLGPAKLISTSKL